MSTRIKPVELKTNLGTFVLHGGHVLQEMNHHQEKNHGRRDLYICRHLTDDVVIKLYYKERRFRDMTIVVDADENARVFENEGSSRNNKKKSIYTMMVKILD